MASETPDRTKRITQRYNRDMFTAAGLYTAFVFAGAYAVRNLDLPQWAVIVASLAPLLPALLMLRAFVVFMNASDEFQRRIQSDAIIFAAATVGFGSFAYGFLEEWAGFPHLPLIWVLPSLIFAWGIALCVVRLRYK